MKMIPTAQGASLGALGRTTNWLLGIGNQISSNWSSGGLPPVATLGIANGINLAGAFPVGSTGPEGLSLNDALGRAHLFYLPVAGLRDSYCAQTMVVDLKRPPVKRVHPFAVWECEVDVSCRLPAGAIAGDLGLILHGDTGTTGWGTDFANAGGSVGIGRFGVGLVAMGADNQLHCVARSSVGGPITLDIPTGIIAQPVGGSANDRVRRLKIRLESATPSADAKCTWFVDDAAVATRNFLSSANMPSMDLVTGGVQWLGTFRAFVRNSNNNVSGAVLGLSHWRVSSAPSIAAMG